MPSLEQEVQEPAGKLSRIGEAARRGFEAGIVRAHIKPSEVGIGEIIVGELGYQDFVYSSCSIYRGLEAFLTQDSRARMIKTNNEHNSPGLAGGLSIGGRKVVMMSQNSAAFNEGDGMLTFLGRKVNDVPVLVLMSWRKDMESEPHGEIGRITDPLTRLLAGDEFVFGDREGNDFIKNLKKGDQVVQNRIAKKRHMAIVRMPDEAFENTYEPLPQRRTEEEIAHMKERYQAVLAAEAIIAEHKGTFTETNPFPTDKAFDRFEAAQMVVEYYRKHYKNVRFVVSNGFNARTLLAIFGNDPSFLYLPGYMGGAAAVGVGLGMAREDVHVVVLDGNENRQMSAMDKHLKINDRPNVEIVTFDDGLASSVGGAKSLDFTSDEYRFSRVVQTYPSVYPRFAKEVDRVQSSAEHTREFARVLKSVRPARRTELSATAVLESGRLPQF